VTPAKGVYDGLEWAVQGDPRGYRLQTPSCEANSNSEGQAKPGRHRDPWRTPFELQSCGSTVVAEVLPPQPQTPSVEVAAPEAATRFEMPDFKARLRKLWGDKPWDIDTTALVSYIFESGSDHADDLLQPRDRQPMISWLSEVEMVSELTARSAGAAGELERMVSHAAHLQFHLDSQNGLHRHGRNRLRTRQSPRSPIRPEILRPRPRNPSLRRRAPPRRHRLRRLRPTPSQHGPGRRPEHSAISSRPGTPPISHRNLGEGRVIVGMAVLRGLARACDQTTYFRRAVRP
jgi:hypothetical protein